MLLDDLAADRQPEPETELHPAVLGREARLEDPIDQVGRDAGAVVPHAHAHPIASPVHGHGQPAPVVHRVQRIDEQVRPDLLQRSRSGADWRHRRVVPVDLDCVQPVRHEPQGVVEAGGDVDVGMHRSPPVLAAGVAPEAPDQRSDSLGRAVDPADRLTESGRGLQPLQLGVVGPDQRQRLLRAGHPTIDEPVREGPVADGSCDLATKRPQLRGPHARRLELAPHHRLDDRVVDDRRDVVGEMVDAAQQRRGRVVQLVGHTGGHLAERREPRAGHELGPRLGERGEALVELDLELVGPPQPVGQRRDQDPRHHPGQLRFGGERLSELVEGDRDRPDVGHGLATQHRCPVTGERQKPDDRPGRSFVEDEVAGAGVRAEADRPVEDQVDAADVLALFDEDRAGAEPEAGRVAERPVDQLDEPLLQFVVVDRFAEQRMGRFPRRPRRSPFLLDPRPGGGEVLGVEELAELLEPIRCVLDEVRREVRLEELAQPGPRPGAGDHPVDGTELERLVDVVQRRPRRDQHGARRDERRLAVEGDHDVGSLLGAEVEVDEGHRDDPARRFRPVRDRQRLLGARHDLDVGQPGEQVAHVGGERRPLVGVRVDHQDHRPIAHSSPSPFQIGGMTNTTSTIPITPTMMPTVAMSRVSISPEA